MPSGPKSYRAFRETDPWRLFYGKLSRSFTGCHGAAQKRLGQNSIPKQSHRRIRHYRPSLSGNYKRLILSPKKTRTAFYLEVAQIEFSRSLVLTQSCNRHAIRANITKPSDANFCHANDSYKVKKTCQKEGSASRVLDPTFTISKTLGTKKLKVIDNFVGTNRCYPVNINIE